MEMTHSAHALSKCSTPGFNGHMSKTIFLTYAIFVGFSFGLFLPLTLHVSLSLSENRDLTSNEAKFLRDVLILRMAIIFHGLNMALHFARKTRQCYTMQLMGLEMQEWIWSVMLLRKRVLLLQ